MTESLAKESGQQSGGDVEDQNSWVLDSLVGFLKGPVWSLTIQSFVEQKSVVFDPEDQISEDIEQEYRLLFKEYKNLVDRLLSSHMSDLLISPEQFDEACRRADGLLASKFKQLLFEQIWAANDFQIFIRFMTQRNIELQLQALEVLAQRFGLIYESFIPLGANREDYLNDEVIFNEAIKRSLAESDSFDDESGQPSDDKTAENKTNDLSRESQQMFEEKHRLENERMKEQEKLSLAIQSVLTIEDSPSETDIDSKQTKQLPKLKEDLIQYKPIEQKTTELQYNEEPNETNPKPNPIVREPIPESGPGLSVEEIRKRSEYLRKQRDKLLEIKKQERNKQMSKLEEQELLAKRPKSARVMRSVAENNHSSDDESGDQSLAFRRSLAARLKAEVIEQQKH